MESSPSLKRLRIGIWFNYIKIGKMSRVLNISDINDTFARGLLALSITMGHHSKPLMIPCDSSSGVHDITRGVLSPKE